MDAFKTHKSVVDSYSTYIKSFIDIKDQRMRELVEKSQHEIISIWRNLYDIEDLKDLSIIWGTPITIEEGT